MLDQVALADACNLRVDQQLTHDVELVIAWPDLHPLFVSGFLVLRLDDLGVVLQDVTQAIPCQNAFPQVVALETVRVGRIARAVVPTLIERQKPRCFSLEVGAETHLVVIHREMRHATTEPEELFTRVAIAFVLLDCICYGLLGEAVLQLQGRNRQTIEEEGEIKRQLGFVQAVAKLSRDREAVKLVERPGLLVALRRRAVAKVDMMRSVIDSLAQDVDGAAFADFALQPCQKLALRRAVPGGIKRFENLGLRLP